MSNQQFQGRLPFKALSSFLAAGLIVLLSLIGIENIGRCNMDKTAEKTSVKRQTQSQLKLLVTDWTRSYKLYGQPHAIWLSNYSNVGCNTRLLQYTLDQAAKKHQNPEIVIYSIPLRDLGQSSEGGFSNYEEYWKDNVINAGLISQFSKTTGLTSRVYIEPDALSLSVQYKEDNHFNAESVEIYQKRIAVIAKLIKLYQDAGAYVYLDAAHSDWFDYSDEQVGKIATALNDARIDLADGLVTNVSNRQTINSEDRNEWHYTGRLLPKLNNKQLDVVVDSSRNGGPTFPRKYWLAPNGYVIDNQSPAGRFIGYWRTDEDRQVRIYPIFGKAKILSRLLEKEKYQYNLKTSILTAPKWLDPIGDVQPGAAPTDSPPLAVRNHITRLRYIKPPDDCDGAINCPPGASKSIMIQESEKHQPVSLPAPPPGIWF